LSFNKDKQGSLADQVEAQLETRKSVGKRPVAAAEGEQDRKENAQVANKPEGASSHQGRPDSRSSPQHQSRQGSRQGSRGQPGTSSLKEWQRGAVKPLAPTFDLNDGAPQMGADAPSEDGRGNRAGPSGRTRAGPEGTLAGGTAGGTGVRDRSQQLREEITELAESRDAALESERERREALLREAERAARAKFADNIGLDARERELMAADADADEVAARREQMQIARALELSLQEANGGIDPNSSASSSDQDWALQRAMAASTAEQNLREPRKQLAEGKEALEEELARLARARELDKRQKLRGEEQVRRDEERAKWRRQQKEAEEAAQEAAETARLTKETEMKEAEARAKARAEEAERRARVEVEKRQAKAAAEAAEKRAKEAEQEAAEAAKKQAAEKEAAERKRKFEEAKARTEERLREKRRQEAEEAERKIREAAEAERAKQEQLQRELKAEEDGMRAVRQKAAARRIQRYFRLGKAWQDARAAMDHAGAMARVVDRTKNVYPQRKIQRWQRAIDAASSAAEAWGNAAGASSFSLERMDRAQRQQLFALAAEDATARALQDYAASLLQRAWKSAVQRQEEKARERQQQEAAKSIQASFREYRGRLEEGRRAKAQALRRHHSAAKLQRGWRRVQEARRRAIQQAEEGRKKAEEDKAEADRKKAEADHRKKAEEKAEADRKKAEEKAEADRKKAEEKAEADKRKVDAAQRTTNEEKTNVEDEKAKEAAKRAEPTKAADASVQPSSRPQSSVKRPVGHPVPPTAPLPPGGRPGSSSGNSITPRARSQSLADAPAASQGTGNAAGSKAGGGGGTGIDGATNATQVLDSNKGNNTNSRCSTPSIGAGVDMSLAPLVGAQKRRVITFSAAAKAAAMTTMLSARTQPVPPKKPSPATTGVAKGIKAASRPQPPGVAPAAPSAPSQLAPVQVTPNPNRSNPNSRNPSPSDPKPLGPLPDPPEGARLPGRAGHPSTKATPGSRAWQRAATVCKEEAAKMHVRVNSANKGERRPGSAKQPKQRRSSGGAYAPPVAMMPCNKVRVQEVRGYPGDQSSGKPPQPQAMSWA
ncbi:hypothetical protein CYMTET_50736, partial [Cymbomonas tetramitiformis]